MALSRTKSGALGGIQYINSRLTCGTLSGSLTSDSRGLYSCSESSTAISSTRRFTGAAARLPALSGFCRHTGRSD